MSGIILVTVPTIQYGGYFLLTSLMDKKSGYMENALRQNFFRAGHAHAGVIVILSLVCQLLADAAVLPYSLLWLIRIGVPLAAILISAGFFLSVLSPAATQPSGAVSLIYAGALVLAVGVVALGIGLVRVPPLRYRLPHPPSLRVLPQEPPRTQPRHPHPHQTKPENP